MVAKVGDDAPRVVTYEKPSLDGQGRNPVWQIKLAVALPEGAQVRALGLLVEERKFVPLGALFILQAGKLVVAGE